MTCTVSHGVVFCQLTPLGFGFGLWFLVTIGVLVRHFAPEWSIERDDASEGVARDDGDSDA